MQDHELENATSCPFAYERTLQLPAHVTCLALGGHGHLYVGSSDGSLRVYDLQTVKVVKAIQALGDEVASVACLPKPNQNLDDVFLSVGRRIMSFGFPEESTKMIQKASDALMCIDVGDEDDVLNEVPGISNIDD
ncbi:hypothetical protein ONZ45_g16554 [Pleurotus djamor]|nr:hypothetical protein ONZ45_g16554 [Pleurotus djamor]